MLLGELDIGVGDVTGKLGSANTAASGLMAGLGKLGLAAAAVTAGLAAVATVAAGVGDVLDFGGKLNDLSLSTGESAENLVVLGQAFENAGLGADASGDFILKLQDSIAGVNSESGAAAAALAKMGLSAENLRTKDALQQIEALQDGFAKLDQTSKVAAARDLFGKSGGKALALLNDPGALAQAKQQAGPLAATMSANLEGFDRLGDALNGVALSGKEFFAGFLEPLAPFFADVAEYLSSIDFTAVGRGLGNLVLAFIEFEQAVFSMYQKIASFIDGLTGGLFSKAAAAIGNLGAAIAGPAKESTGENRLGRFLGDSGRTPELQVSSLQKFGGGGRFGGGDAYLTEAQRQTAQLKEQTAVLKQIAAGRSEYAPAV